MDMTKKQLAITLSKLTVFENPSIKHEQYPTDSEVAAEVLWQAYMLGDISQKVLADLGCGTGILGIGALLLGAKKVYFVEMDSAVLESTKANFKGLAIDKKRAEFLEMDVKEFKESVDLVIQNPPFGTKVSHADKEFLEAATGLSDLVYSFHKSSTDGFVRTFARDKGYKVSHRWDFSFPLKKTQKFHKRAIFRIEVSCYRLARNG